MLMSRIILVLLVAWPLVFPMPVLGQLFDRRYPLGGRQQTSPLMSDPALEYFHALDLVRRNAAKLESHLEEKLPETRKLLQQTQEDAEFLRSKWMDWSRRNSARPIYSGNVQLDSYFRTLKSTARELQRLREANDKEIVQAVEGIAADIRAKAENCRHSADGLGKQIKVSVRTLKEAKELAGYEVWCAPIALVRIKNEHIRFPIVSSPAVVQNLAPGRYALWTKKDQQASEPVPQTIGGQGQTELEIELLVP